MKGKVVTSMNRRLGIMTIVLTVCLVALSMAGCRPADRTATPEPVAKPETTAKPVTTLATSTVLVYFNRGEKLGVGGRELAIADDVESLANAAVQQLIEGPTAEEKEFGLGTSIPAGTRLLGTSIEGNSARADLSAEFASGGGSLSMQLRAAQVVFTLTQFEGIENAQITIDGVAVEGLGGEGVQVGPAVTRADFENVVPAILVEHPYLGQTITSPVTITGTSNVFEAVHQLNVTDAEGGIVAEKVVNASSGTGTRGTWSVTCDFTTPRDGLGEIIVWAASPKDGSQTDLVEVEVWMRK